MQVGLTRLQLILGNYEKCVLEQAQPRRKNNEDAKVHRPVRGNLSEFA